MTSRKLGSYFVNGCKEGVNIITMMPLKKDPFTVQQTT
jgi:hypothetical protein